MKVSVIIPAYQAAEFLGRSVSSALAQTLSDLEVIVIDDASLDATAEVAKSLCRRDARVRLIEQPKNRGVSAARNAGIASARGEWIAILDADDAYLPDRLEKLVSLAESRGADLVIDDICYYDWADGSIAAMGIGINKPSFEVVTIETFLENAITGISSPDFSVLKGVFRSQFLRFSAIEYRDGLGQGEDFLIYCQVLLAGGKTLLWHEPLYLYTERVGRISRSSADTSRTIENCARMREVTLELVADPRVASNKAAIALLRKRASAIVWYAAWERVYQPLRRRKYIRAAVAAVASWRATIMLSREILRRVASR